MATTAIITSWGVNVSGREQIALGVFMTAVQYFTERKKNGEIEDLRVYIANDGDVNATAGHMVVEGSASQIAAILGRDDYKTIIIKAAHMVHSLRTSTFTTGDAISRRIELLQSARKELGI